MGELRRVIRCRAPYVHTSSVSGDDDYGEPALPDKVQGTTSP